MQDALGTAGGFVKMGRSPSVHGLCGTHSNSDKLASFCSCILRCTCCETCMDWMQTTWYMIPKLCSGCRIESSNQCKCLHQSLPNLQPNSFHSLDLLHDSATKRDGTPSPTHDWRGWEFSSQVQSQILDFGSGARCGGTRVTWATCLATPAWPVWPLTRQVDNFGQGAKVGLSLATARYTNMVPSCHFLMLGNNRVRVRKCGILRTEVWR